MLNHTFTWNGHSSDEFGIKIERFRALNRSARKYDAASVPGRNGNIYGLQNAWEEVLVSYEIWAKSEQNTDLEARWTDIVEWLNSADGYAELSDTYDTDHYREAVFVEATDIANSWNNFGRAVVSFRCRPERFLSNNRNVDLDLTDTVSVSGYTNDTLYLRVGPGSPYDIMTQMEAGTTVFILREGYLGTHTAGTDLNIREAPNTSSSVIGVVGDGENFLILGQESNNWYHIYYADIAHGVQRSEVIGYVNPTYVTQGALWYKVQVEGFPIGYCAAQYVTRENSVVLNNPTNHTAYPVINLFSDGSDIYGSIKINGIAADCDSRQFYRLSIDCERQNITGENASDYGQIKSYNQYTKILDSVGSATAKYLELRPGDNYIVVSADIAAVNVDTRFWEK